MTDTIKETLEERGKRYGPFMEHSNITQSLKVCMSRTTGWNRLNSDQRECLDMIAHKIGRILNGDPNYIDSWVDIAGYAQLVVNRLEQEGGK